MISRFFIHNTLLPACLGALAAIAAFGCGKDATGDSRGEFQADAQEVESAGSVVRTLTDLGPDPLNVTVTRDEPDNLIGFSETHPGDYNGDGLVNGLDVFRLAAHFGHDSNFNGHTATDAEDDCIDGNTDGVLNGLDLFLIAANFNDLIRGYNVFSSTDEAGPFETLVNMALIEYEGCGAVHQFRHEDADEGLFYEVHSALEWSGDLDPPEWDDTTGLQQALPGAGEVKLRWNKAVDEASPPVKYNVYVDTVTPLDFTADEKLTGVDAKRGQTYDWEFTVDGLTDLTEYYFAVRAEDSSQFNNEDDNAVQLSATPGSATGEWSFETVDDLGRYGGRRPDMNVDQDDLPGIVYMGGSDDEMRFARFDGFEWQIEVVDSVDEEREIFASVVFLENNLPLICYYDTDTLHLTLARFDGDEWQFEELEDDNGAGAYTSMACGPDGKIAIAYGYYSHQDLRCARYDGSEWTIDEVRVDYENGMYCNSIAYKPDGNPAIAYFADYDDSLKYTSFDGTEWPGMKIDAEDSTGRTSSLAFAPDGQPAASFSYYKTGEQQVRYARFDGTEWNVEAIDVFEGDTGTGLWASSSLAFGPDGHPRIAYYHSTDLDLKYAEYDGAEWTLETMESEGDVGFWPTLIILDSGEVLLSYTDLTEGAEKLRFARRK